ncbi:hypothetical protein BaRGS_00024103 [Batillaria attramentaria]|uniref:Uncharacterized protein n=1 Tax=Batillaria attramentaria TaxID=370345 RepID=A0ABD0KC76_9CAEN
MTQVPRCVAVVTTFSKRGASPRRFSCTHIDTSSLKWVRRFYGRGQRLNHLKPDNIVCQLPAGRERQFSQSYTLEAHTYLQCGLPAEHSPSLDPNVSRPPQSRCPATDYPRWARGWTMASLRGPQEGVMVRKRLNYRVLINRFQRGLSLCEGGRSEQFLLLSVGRSATITDIFFSMRPCSVTAFSCVQL